MANQQDNTISAFSIGSTGALTPVSGSPFTGTAFYPTALAASSIIPFAFSNPTLETEAGTPATFTLNDTFFIGKNSGGINPLVQTVVLRIGSLSVMIPPGKFTRMPNGTNEFNGTIDNVTYKMTFTFPGNASIKFAANGSGKDLTKLGKDVPVLLSIGVNGGSSIAPHKQ